MEAEHDDVEDAWWILDPIGHRKHDNEEKRKWLAEEEEGVSKVAVGPDLPLDMWVCDWCNGDIQVVIDGISQMVPMIASYALCWPCLDKHLARPGNEKWLAIRQKGGHPLDFWSWKICGCPADEKVVEDLARKVKEKNDGETGQGD